MCPQFHPEEWKGVSQSAIHFVRHLLVYDPNGRLTATEALSHEWINRWNFDGDAAVAAAERSSGSSLRSPRRLYEGLGGRFKSANAVQYSKRQYDTLMKKGRFESAIDEAERRGISMSDVISDRQEKEREERKRIEEYKKK